jgi:hypothetical protein
MTNLQVDRRNLMSRILVVLLLAIPTVAQQRPPDDAIRIAEFYRLAAEIPDQIWPGSSKVSAPLLQVTDKTEFLVHDPTPPTDFSKE